MRFNAFIAVGLLVGGFTSCAADSSITNGCPPAVTILAPEGWELGAGAFTARREGNTIALTAKGEHPTAGYQVQLAQHPMKIYPPQFVLYRKRPEGLAAQVLTPFTACVSFKGPVVESVTVRDSKGEHRIAVESR